MEVISQGDWPVAWQWVLLVCASIAALGGAANYIHKALMPVRDVMERVGQHDVRLDKHDKLLDNDNQRFITSAEADKVMCRSMLAIMDHSITGNSIDKLKSAREDLQNYIINR